MEIHRILCPTDFSAASEHAIEQAVAIAGYYRARIAAVHAVTSPAVAESGGAPSSADPVDTDSLRRVIDVQFAAAAAKRIPVDVLIEFGPPATVILDRAAALPADLIVIGTHGTSGFQHFVLGSVAEKVLRTSACPVLTVPPRTQATSQLPFRRLLCAVDFSDASIDAVGTALSLAEQSGATLTLLHVVEWPWDEPPAPHLAELPPAQAAALAEFRRYTEESASKRLESLVPASVPSSRVQVRLRSGKPYVQILEEAAVEQSDLIVIGVRGRNPVDLAVFGSTTNHVVRRATCPVLTLR